ncbi:MAG: hypothetical protein WD770_01835 [Actinomycetota bacterium]
MGELKELLEREARRVAADPDAIEGVVRRAERRHRTRRVVAGATAFAVVIGVGLGAWTLLGDRGDVTPGDETPPVEDKWPAGAWPHETRAEAEEAQRRADAGDPEYTWHLDAEEMAIRYAAETFGWTETYFDDSLDGQSGMVALTLYVASCDIAGGGYEPCEGTSTPEGDQEALLSFERLVRQDDTGVWTLTDVGGPNDLRRYANFMYGRLPIGFDEAACPEPPVAPADDATVEEAAVLFMADANFEAGRPENLWKWLDASSHPRQGDPDLFAYHFRNTPVTSEYATYEITYVGADFPNDLAIAERCGQDVRDALTAVEVTFPNVAEGGESTALLVWVTHPEGPRLWYVQ